MGYMGFGMQSWIYRMRPRKPFSMERKKSFSKTPVYHREFKMQPSKKSTGLNVILGGVLICMFLGIGVLYASKFVGHSNEINKEIAEVLKADDEQAFLFLINSGKKRLLNNNIVGAYSEFNLAFKIKPEDEAINQFLIETLSILCEKDIKYCNELDKVMAKRM